MGMQKLSVTDYAFIAGVVLICIIMAATGAWKSIPYAMAAGAIAWCAGRIWYIRSLLRTGVPTDAVVVNYSVKTVKQATRSGYTNEYQIYAPVLRYETETQILEEIYPSYRRERWFQDGEQMRICYVPEKPELIYFPGREGELTSDYWLTIIIVVAAAFMYGISFQ